MFNTILQSLQKLFPRFLENELIRRIIKNSGYLFSATGISAVMSFFQGVMAARLLGPATFGVLGAVTTFTSTINRFASFRMNELVVRYVGHFRERGDTQRAAAVFKASSMLEMGGSILAFVLIWYLAPLGSNFFARDESLTLWFRIYGSIVLANLISESATGLLQIFDRFRALALITIAQSSLTLILIVIAFINRWGLIAIIIAYMSGKVLGAFSLTFVALRDARFFWGANWWRSPLSALAGQRRSLLTFAVSTNLSGTISLVSKDSEVLWVAAFLGPTQAGYYKLALALSNLLQLPVSPLPKATFPELAREIARRSWDNVRYVLRQGSRLSALYSIPTTLFLVIFGRWIIAYIYRPDFLPTYPALIILLTGFTFVNVFYWNRVALLSLGRPVFPTLVNFVGMVLKITVIFLFVHQYGYLVFAFSLAGYYIFTVGIATVRVLIDLQTRMAAPGVV
jgi:O-antigen/teichoic acid export membrane protein